MAQLFMLSAAFPAEPIRIAVSQTPLSLPIYIAQSEGYFAAEGLTVRLTEHIGGHRTMQQLLDGGADIATSSEAVVMFSSFLRNDFCVIASFVTSTDDVKLIARAGSGISSPQHLAGKRIGTVVGSAIQYYLDTLLVLNGVDYKSLQIRDLPPEAMAAALRNGEVDAIAIWEPFAFRILSTLPESRVLPRSNNYRLSFNLVIDRNFRGVRDDDLVKLLRAIERAEGFIAAHPAQAQAILRASLKLDQRFIDWIWSGYHYRLTLDQSLLSTLEGEARWARREGLVKGEQSPNYLDFIYSGPLRRAQPAAVSITE